MAISIPCAGKPAMKTPVSGAQYVVLDEKGNELAKGTTDQQGLVVHDVPKTGKYSIGVSDPPRDMFGKAMRISDALLPKFLRLLTPLPDAAIEALLAPGTNPRDSKLALAEALPSFFARDEQDLGGSRPRHQMLVKS